MNATEAKVRNIVTAADHAELRKAYKFVLEEDSQHEQQSCVTVPQHYEQNDANHADKTVTDGKHRLNNSEATPHNNPTKYTNGTWQERMVQKYHSHLYKSHVIADFSKQTQKSPSNIGLRWRIKAEVENGKGFETCGNKHCPCYFDGGNDSVSNSDIFKAYDELPLGSGSNSSSRDDNFETQRRWSKMKKRRVEEIIRWKKNRENRQILRAYQQQLNQNQSRRNIQSNYEDDDGEVKENQRIQSIPYGLGLFDYTVHFSYLEHNKQKQELVQLKLCIRCAPKLFYGKGGAFGALNARKKQSSINDVSDDQCYNHDVKKIDGGVQNQDKNDDMENSIKSRSSHEKRTRKKEKKRKRKAEKEKRKKDKLRNSTEFETTKKRKHRKKAHDDVEDDEEDEIESEKTLLDALDKDIQAAIN